MTSPIVRAIALALVAAFATAGGYRLGTGHWPSPAVFAHWTSGDGAAPATLELRSAPDVLGQAPSKSLPVNQTATGRILYYRNPMGLPDTSPVPKKDWMGMDYIPVYEGEEPESTSAIKVSLEKVQRSGVRTEAAVMKTMTRTVRAPGVAKPDETTLRSITLRFDGYIERLYANETGRAVEAGEALFSIYSPEVASAVIDYRRQISTASLRAREDAAQLARVVDQRFRNLDIPESVLSDFKASGAVPDRFDWPSPAAGTLIEKMAVEGQMVKAGDELYRMADISRIWVIASVAEQDLSSVKAGATASVTFRALPDERFDGKVTFISPDLDAATRTAKVRVEVENPKREILLEMYADVEIGAPAGDAQRVAVPASALIDSGTKQTVIVEKGEGRFEPRRVVPGLRSDGFVEIREGVTAGERVVVAANFLIDAESNLKAALDQFAAPRQSAAKPLGDGTSMHQGTDGGGQDRRTDGKTAENDP